MDIKSFRIKHKLSVADLASKVGVSVMTIYRLEKNPKKKLHKLIQEKLDRVMRGYN